MRLQYLLPHQFKTAIDEGWPLLVPTGCIEYHGPHMALGLDTIVVAQENAQELLLYFNADGARIA